MVGTLISTSNLHLPSEIPLHSSFRTSDKPICFFGMMLCDFHSAEIHVLGVHMVLVPLSSKAVAFPSLPLLYLADDSPYSMIIILIHLYVGLFSINVMGVENNSDSCLCLDLVQWDGLWGLCHDYWSFYGAPAALPACTVIYPSIFVLCNDIYSSTITEVQPCEAGRHQRSPIVFSDKNMVVGTDAHVNRRVRSFHCLCLRSTVADHTPQRRLHCRYEIFPSILCGVYWVDGVGRKTVRDSCQLFERGRRKSPISVRGMGGSSRRSEVLGNRGTCVSRGEGSEGIPTATWVSW